MNEIACLVDSAETELMALPQVECPVVHRFGPGIYIREVTMPAGIIAIGHAQRFAHTNLMLKGRVRVLNEDGSTTELVAPLFFVGKPGRKIGYVLEEVVWQNIYATTETDIDTLEATYLDKSAAWQANDMQMRRLESMEREADREDYEQMLQECGFTHETALAQSINEADQVPMPHSTKVTVRDSAIQGKGVFLSSPCEAGEVIAPARISGMRTPAGRYTNHSKTPNAVMVLRANGDIHLVALRRIDGCKGGDQGEEVTIDYRQALGLSGVKRKLCLE